MVPREPPFWGRLICFSGALRGVLTTMQAGVSAEHSVLIIGAGNLAWSLACGLVRGGVLSPRQLRVTNRSDDGRLARFAEELGARTGRDLGRLADGADTILLLVKPQDAPDALAALAPHLGATGSAPVLLISAVAGLPLAYIDQACGGRAALIRAMPNTSLHVGMSATALAAVPGTDPGLIARARAVFAAVGVVVEVSESDLDTVTAVSGSGPAYLYLFCESLITAAERAGLRPELASLLAIQTIRGAAAMLELPGADPAELRRQVTSARGTTEAGISAMKDRQLPDAVLEAVLSAKRRAGELSRGFAAPVRPE